MANELFLGTQDQMEEFYRSKGVEAPAGLTIKKKEEEQKGRRMQAPDEKLNPDTLEPMDEEELFKLKRVRLRHDSDTVYMQSDVDFYDYFYKAGESADPLTRAAHQIKRVYMNADDYFYALDVRDAYIDMVTERDFNGNQYLFNKAMNNGDIYIPPTPFYSKRANDYDIVMAGGQIQHDNDPDIDVEKIKEWLDDWWKEAGKTPDDVIVTDDVLTAMWVLDEIGSVSDNRIRSNGTMVMSVTDIKAVQNTLNSIYQNRQSQTSGGSRLFSKTPASIRKEYEDSFRVPVADMLARAIRGEDLDDNKEDPNAMVYDKTTGKPMTRKEYKQRVLTRHLASIGWSELAIMKAFNIGSAYERRKMTEESRSNVRKLKKGLAKALEHQLDYTDSPKTTFSSSGTPDRYYDPMEELQKYFGGEA